MGLHVHSISNLPLSETRAYYIYVLDYYSWDEPVSNSLQANFSKIESFCAKNDAVMVKGLPDSHFYSDVLSWVGINGQDPGTVLPALLITTVHPRYFIEANNQQHAKDIRDSMVFLKIRDICKTPGEVVDLLEKVFSDIKSKKNIRDFTIARELRAGEHGALVDALILEPNISGLGINIKKLVSWFKSRGGNASA